MGRLTILILVLILTIWGAATPELPTAYKTRTVEASGYPVDTDAELYQAVIQRVRLGEDYYSAVAAEHRQNAFPLKPFFTVRLPTLAELVALVGKRAAIALMWAILTAGAFTWYKRLPSALERISTMGILAVTGATVISGEGVYFAEIWAGLLLTLALALKNTGRICAASAALAFRELTIPFLALSALLNRQRAAWLVIGLFLIGFAVHARNVTLVSLPSDISSTGWFGLRGPGGLVGDLVSMSFLQVLPWPVACLAAFLPLLGWHEYGTRDRYHALAWFSGFGLVISVAARSDNFYWCALILPAYFIGLALVPAFAKGLAVQCRAWRPNRN